MSNFSPLERSLAKVLSKVPFVKSIAKYFYARLVYLANSSPEKIVTSKKVDMLGVSAEETFFGYYDKSPINRNGLVLFYSTNSPTNKAPNLEPVTINVYCTETCEIIFSIKTRAYNWQQGSRVHWVSDDEFIFNDYDSHSDSYYSRLFSVSKKLEIMSYSFPIQDTYQKDYFLSINYERLMSLRPDYGYRNKKILSKCDLYNANDDGIWKIDFKTNEANILISIDELCKKFPNKLFANALHKINHVMISPNGENFIFMHRYLINGQRFDRLFVCDKCGGNIKLLADNGMVSHCFWKGNNTIFGYLRGKGGKDGYWIIDIDNLEFTPFKNTLLETLGDGHPHVFGDYFITDTYPNKARMQKLLLGNFRTGNVEVIGEFFHGFSYSGESRCDLHPRFSIDGKYVFFDSVFTGKRNLYKMEVSL
ncbi:glycosyl transferase [Pseudoalteromonas gelatinilytica]|uniref:Glycosyl transferase n=1 Tax=Pseudoalteromonas gelatinilytica TaxID=1703256 RepID=A0A3A3EPB9_9GAMM|nr:glycosyl transferase [Pseudoalteromonas profundi]RJF37995.1 glycosyl transferase [Pseudoalteromonas profundi]